MVQLGPMPTKPKGDRIPDHSHSIEFVKCEWCGSVHTPQAQGQKCRKCGGQMLGKVIYAGR